MTYTILSDEILNPPKSHVKQVIATVLIALFFGVGAAYLVNRNTSQIETQLGRQNASPIIQNQTP